MNKKCILINQERRQSIIEYIQNNYKCNIFYNGGKTVYLTCKIFNHSFVIRISDHYHSKLNWSGIDLILRPGAKRVRIKTQYKGEFILRKEKIRFDKLEELHKQIEFCLIELYNKKYD